VHAARCRVGPGEALGLAGRDVHPDGRGRGAQRAASLRSWSAMRGTRRAR
jgi:hypothetical protein